jgi:hypothetical protein
MSEVASRAIKPAQPLMPDGAIDGPAAWYGPDMEGSSDWIHRLSEAEIAEIDAALAAARSRKQAVIDICPADFLLPRLGPVLRARCDEVMNGRGFALIRGLPVDRYSLEDAAIVYFGIGAHMGSARSQNAEGHVLGHICDIGHDHHKNADQRGYRAPGPLEFHTDSVDLVALMCLQPAMKGGASKIVSTVTAYNEILKRRPELLRVLFEPFHRDRRGEVPAGKDPWWIMPILQWRHGRLFSHYSSTYVRSVERFPDVPRFTEAQRAAIDLLETVANDPSVHLRMELEAGDIQLVNNHCVLHGREGYEDWPGGERNRYLLRLWICPPDGPPMPPAYAERYGSIAVGDRGGIVVPGTKLQAPLEPI